LQCTFCEFRCTIPEGSYGRCGIRYNNGSSIQTVNYGEHVSLAVDPVEKKPLYHVLPGSKVLSSALFGCNFTCSFCQNCTISQKQFRDTIRTRRIEPDELAQTAVSGGYPLLAFTYSEPTVWSDYVVDAARAAAAHNVRSVMVTNGYFTGETLERLLPYISAFNIDLKGGEEFYRSLCGGHVEPVLRNIRSIAAMEDGPVLEVTTMLLEGKHTEHEIMSLAGKLDEAGVKVWHLSAFHPASQMSDHAATSGRFLEEIYDRATRETDIPHIYAYSPRRAAFADTHCPACGALCIRRSGFSVSTNTISDGICNECGTRLYGLFSL
jgi:pyruvate formate lyase activating enzyme